MSVTITIDNNKQFCEDTNTFVEELVVCPYCDGGAGHKSCKSCEYTGKVTIRRYPHALNLCNERFYLTMKYLVGYLPLPYGSIDGRILIRKIEMIGSETITDMADRLDITRDYAHTILDGIEEVAKEAEKREEPVIWS